MLMRLYETKNHERVFNIIENRSDDEPEVSNNEAQGVSVICSLESVQQAENDVVIINTSSGLEEQILIFEALMLLQPKCLIFENEFKFIPTFMFQVLNVQKLVLQNVDYNYSSCLSFINTIIYCFPDLEVLDLSNIRDESMLKINYPTEHKVASLIIREYQFLDGESLSNIAEGFPKLHELFFIDCTVKTGQKLKDGIVELLLSRPQSVYFKLLAFNYEDLFEVGTFLKSNNECESALYFDQFTILHYNDNVFCSDLNTYLSNGDDLVIPGYYDENGQYLGEETSNNTLNVVKF